MKRLALVSFIALMLAALSGCGVVGLAEETRDETKAMNKKMDVTNNGVHLQILGLALQDLLSPESTDNLESVTVPMAMMRGAKTFADEATPLELIETFYTFYKDMLLGLNEGADVLTPENLRLHQRYVSRMAGSLIAAWASDEKFEAIMREQIEEKGRYEFAAYTFAYARYDALKHYFFHDVSSGTGGNVASLREAVRYFKSMRAVATKPYADKFHLKMPKWQLLTEVSKSEPLNPPNVEEVLKPNELPKQGKNAYNFYKAALGPDLLKNQDVQGLLKELHQAGD